jgi:hypothetical protein
MREHRGLSIVLALASVGFFTGLAFALTVAIWVTLSVYALVKMIGSAPDSADPVVVLVSIVLLVGVFATSFAGAIALVGRPMTPRKRRDREAQRTATS